MGNFTALDIVKRVAGRNNIPPPNALVANQDANIVQMLGLLNAFGEDLQTRRSTWFDASFWYDPTAGNAPRQYIAKDTDKAITPDALPIAWLEWKWKSKKGLEYAEDFAAYERLIGMYVMRETGATLIDATQGPANNYDVIVPSLNQRPWGVRRW